MAPPPRALTAVYAMLVLSSCGQMLFRDDHRITVHSPANFAEVSEPIELRWTLRDFDPPRDGHVLVFLDRSPMPQGETIDYFKRFSRQRIYVADEGKFTFAVLGPRAGVNEAERNHHEVTIVLVDARGRRVGESAGFVEFTVRR